MSAPIREVGSGEGSQQMAFKPKVAAKQPEPAKSMPVFVARAKVNGERWENIGAAWHADINGKPGYSVKLNTIPPEVGTVRFC